MKKFLCMLSALLFLIPSCSASVFAADIDTVPLGICAVTSDNEGNSAIENADAIEELSSYHSYDLYIDKEPVLSVEAHNDEMASTGASLPVYYNAEFMIPDTTLKVYLTGLRSENIEELQQRIIDNFMNDTFFELSDLSFIDTEKTSIKDGDENLCWAAASSNILHYTGWGAEAGFSDEDALFDLFSSSFSDGGSHQENAMAWFFNGAALQNNIITFGGAKVKNYPRSGGYFKDYAYDMVSGYKYIRGAYDMNNMFMLLTHGYGISPGLNLMKNDSNTGTHAVTLWGMVIDETYSIDNAERYRGIMITDSDSHKVNSSDRRNADRVLGYYPLYFSRNLFCFDYYLGYTASLDDFEYLVPYSKDVPRETASSASKDKTKTPDLIISEAYLNDKFTTSIKTLYESGSDLYLQYIVSSAADKPWRYDIKTKRSVTSSDGEVLFSDIDIVDGSFFNGIKYTQASELRYIKLDNVPAGDYTLTFTVNPNRDHTEAYYYNNTRSIDFSVRDSYNRGDYDDNRIVDLIDVSLLQKDITGFNTYKDSKTEERCDIDENGLDIADSTLILRSLCDMEIPYSVGVKALYKGI